MWGQKSRHEKSLSSAARGVVRGVLSGPARTAPTLQSPPAQTQRFGAATLESIAEGACDRLSVVTLGHLLDVEGQEMKYKWQFFLAACFFISYPLNSKDVPLLPVLAG